MLQLILLSFLSLKHVECFAPSSTKLSSFRTSVNNDAAQRFSSSNVLQRMVKEGTKVVAIEQQKELGFEDLQYNPDDPQSSPAPISASKLSSSDITTLSASISETVEKEESTSFSYGQFAKDYPFVNNLGIATFKTGAADFIAQTVIAQTPVLELDVQRTFLFMLFGAVYSGCFQWVYQIQIFKRLFDVDKFTNLTWEEKLKDTEGLKALAAQTALDLAVLSAVYLPAFYIFKAGVFSGSNDPHVWFATGLGDYAANFSKDEADAMKVWFPADLVCFSVPLYLRLPVRHGVSFLWTAYLSFARGGH